MPQLKYKGEAPVFVPALGGKIQPGATLPATAAQVQEFRSLPDWEAVPEANQAPKPGRSAKQTTGGDDE